MREVGSATNIVVHLLSAPSALRTCVPTERRVGHHIGETHCRKLSAKLMFRNRASLVKTLRTEVRFGVLSPQAAGAGINYAWFRGRTAIAARGLRRSVARDKLPDEADVHPGSRDAAIWREGYGIQSLPAAFSSERYFLPHL